MRTLMLNIHFFQNSQKIWNTNCCQKYVVFGKVGHFIGQLDIALEFYKHEYLAAILVSLKT